MITTELKGACNDDGSSAYPVASFDRVAIEYGVKDLSKDLVGWKKRPKAWQLRHGIREFCAPGIWPATDYAEFFRCFGAPSEVLLVTDGVLQTAGGASTFASWRSIELVATEMENSDQKNLVEFLKTQLPSSLTKSRMGFTVGDTLKVHLVWLAFPYSWMEWRDMTERYMYV